MPSFTASARTALILLRRSTSCVYASRRREATAFASRCAPWSSLRVTENLSFAACALRPTQEAPVETPWTSRL